MQPKYLCLHRCESHFRMLKTIKSNWIHTLLRINCWYCSSTCLKSIFSSLTQAMSDPCLAPNRAESKSRPSRLTGSGLGWIFSCNPPFPMNSPRCTSVATLPVASSEFLYEFFRLQVVLWGILESASFDGGFGSFCLTLQGSSLSFSGLCPRLNSPTYLALVVLR